jgi:tRNA (adenine37-N6)-methyltransferase
MSIELSQIGVIHSPFSDSAGTPVQSAGAEGVVGSAEVFPEFASGLQDLQGFERIWLLYWFHRSTAPRLLVTPFLDEQEHGIFSTRSPSRPNPIGISCVRLMSVEGNILQVSDLDVLEGTPVLDIKPYVPAFDCFEVEHLGWLTGKKIGSARADGRFEQPKKMEI